MKAIQEANKFGSINAIEEKNLLSEFRKMHSALTLI